jgi:hypothetical protein
VSSPGCVRLDDMRVWMGCHETQLVAAQSAADAGRASSRATRSNKSGRRQQRGTANAIGKGADRQRWDGFWPDAIVNRCGARALFDWSPARRGRSVAWFYATHIASSQRKRHSERLLVLSMVIGRKNKGLQLLLDRKD